MVRSPRAQPERGLAREMRRFIDANRRLSRICAERFGRIDGSTQFSNHLDRMLSPALRVIDLGAGRHPSIPVATKARLALQVIGVDIAPEELVAAPAGAYNEAIVADATAFSRPLAADLVLSRALDEHARDTEAMWARVYGALVQGGKTLHFIPNGKAFFARLNGVLPHDLKQRILYGIYPEARTHLGFEAFYDRCSPSEVRRLLRRKGFRNIRIHRYYSSNYFSFFVPAQLATIGLQLEARASGVEDACQSFIVEATR